MDLLRGLDPSQHEAVVSEAAPLCILAGAGSGKTRVLTRRVAHAVASGRMDPSHIVALTFTRKAAGELQSRLAVLGVRDRIAAGTFHSVAYAQLRRRWAERGERSPAVLDRKTRLLAPLLPRARASAGKGGPGTVQAADLAAEIEWAKARMIPPGHYESEAAAARRDPPLPTSTMAAIYERYEHDKRRKGLVDFDDLLVACALTLEQDSEFAEPQRWRFRHFFVDEFQDVNPVQFRLLRGWLGSRSSLCVVGDPNQAIYSWNGADPELLTRFRDHFPSAEVLHLDRNYRSTPQLVGVASAALGGERQGPAMKAVRPDGPLPALRRFPTDAAEGLGIARILRRARQPGRRWGHMAVLARTNAQLAILEEHLRKWDIPCRLAGDGALVHQPEVKAALEEMGGAPQAAPFVARLSDLESSLLEDELGKDASIPSGQDGSADRRLNLQALVRLGRDYAAMDPGATVEGFRPWLTTGGRDDQARDGLDAVELTTFHRAKGLEWPVVVVSGLEAGLVPIGHAATPAAEAEERRLLYVAMTRASDELHCTWADRRCFGSRTVARQPSPYLGPIQAALSAMTPEATPSDWRERIRAERGRLAAANGSRPARARRPDGIGADPSVLEALKAWRSAAAKASGVPAYVIFHDSTLSALAEARPSSKAELLALPGLGPVKAERYGDTLLALLARNAS